MKSFRVIEFLILFFVLPLIFYLDIFDFPKIPILLIITIGCYLILIKDIGFDNNRLWNKGHAQWYWKKIIVRFIPISIILFVLTLIINPSNLFVFPRTRPLIWLIVMIFYPILSAYPQELIYRSYFFHRYKILFPRNSSLILVSSIAFSFLHIMYDNWIAVILTFMGSFLFAKTYKEAKSLFWTSVEHALYGAFVFTIGLGQYFYEG